MPFFLFSYLSVKDVEWDSLSRHCPIPVAEAQRWDNSTKYSCLQGACNSESQTFHREACWKACTDPPSGYIQRELRDRKVLMFGGVLCLWREPFSAFLKSREERLWENYLWSLEIPTGTRKWHLLGHWLSQWICWPTYPFSTCTGRKTTCESWPGGRLPRVEVARIVPVPAQGSSLWHVLVGPAAEGDGNGVWLSSLWEKSLCFRTMV